MFMSLWSVLWERNLHSYAINPIPASMTSSAKGVFEAFLSKEKRSFWCSLLCWLSSSSTCKTPWRGGEKRDIRQSCRTESWFMTVLGYERGISTWAHMYFKKSICQCLWEGSHFSWFFLCWCGKEIMNISTLRYNCSREKTPFGMFDRVMFQSKIVILGVLHAVFISFFLGL